MDVALTLPVVASFIAVVLPLLVPGSNVVILPGAALLITATAVVDSGTTVVVV